MALEVGGEGVRERTDGLFAGRLVGVDGEVGIEQLVRLAHRHLEREPAAGGGSGGRGDVVLRQPCVDSIDALLRGRDDVLHLWMIYEVNGKKYDDFGRKRTSFLERCLP